MIKTIYISGGIAGLKPPDVIAYFNALQLNLEKFGFNVYSPIRGKILDTEVSQKYGVNEIVHRDENDIMMSDLMIAFPSIKSIGTYMEIYLARKIRQIPVIVIATDPHIINHYWIRAYASKIVSTPDEAIEYLLKWYSPTKWS